MVVPVAVAVGAVDDCVRASLRVDVDNLELLGGEEGDEVLELALGDGVELVHGAVAHGDGHVERALRRRARPRVPLELNLRHLRVREEHRGFGEVEEGLLQRVEVAHLGLVARLDGVPARRGHESALPRELHPGHRLEQPDENLRRGAVVGFLHGVAELLLESRVHERLHLELLVGVEHRDDVRVEGLALADGRVQVEDGVGLRVRGLGQQEEALDARVLDLKVHRVAVEPQVVGEELDANLAAGRDEGDGVELRDGVAGGGVHVAHLHQAVGQTLGAGVVRVVIVVAPSLDAPRLVRGRDVEGHLDHGVLAGVHDGVVHVKLQHDLVLRGHRDGGDVLGGDLELALTLDVEGDCASLIHLDLPPVAPDDLHIALDDVHVVQRLHGLLDGGHVGAAEALHTHRGRRPLGPDRERDPAGDLAVGHLPDVSLGDRDGPPAARLLPLNLVGAQAQGTLRGDPTGDERNAPEGLLVSHGARVDGP